MSPDSKLMPRQRRVLDVLKAEGDWMSRRAIARSLGISYLSFRGMHVLKALTTQGLIEVRRGRSATNRLRYEYRVKPDGDNAVSQ
jgi:predicted ArsR family transcriptional regulator